MHERRFAGVIALHGERVVLVRERRDSWGGEFWNIPSGRVEAHETPVLGAVRELAEETGLRVAPDGLRLVGTSSTTHGDSRSLAWNFTVMIDRPVLTVDDPDGSILEARWFPRGEAVDVLGRLPYRPLAEPVVAHLREEVAPGSHWIYEAADARPAVIAPTGTRP